MNIIQDFMINNNGSNDAKEKIYTIKNLPEWGMSRDIIYFHYYLILHQYATHIDNKHSWLYCWKGKIYWFDLQYRREAIDVDGGNAKSERELQLFTLKLS